MKQYVQNLRGKPEVVRKRLALGASVGVTAFIGIIWITTLASSGTFALETSKPDSGNKASNDSFSLSGTNVKSNFSQLLGAVGAATGATSSPASLTIVDGGTSSTFTKPQPTNPSATVLPF